MIYFYSNKVHNIKEVEGELELHSTPTTSHIDFLNSLNLVGIDTETNSLDPFIGDMLLLIIGNNHRQFVFDITDEKLFNICKDLITSLESKKVYWIGQNFKFDYKYIKVKFGISLTKVYDTMIAEQRINQGLTEYSIKKNKDVPLSAALDKIIQRRLKVLPKGMDKDIRSEFINTNKNNFIFENRHIFYAAGDIVKLEDIGRLQKVDIQKYNLTFLLYQIEFPLISILGDCELNGFDIDINKWKENIKRNKDLEFQTKINLDKEFKRLRDNYCVKDKLTLISGGKYDRVRIKKEEVKELNLFGDLFSEIEVNNLGKKKKKEKDKNGCLTYTQQEILYIHYVLGFELPTKANTYEIPQFKVSKGKHTLDKSLFTPTTDAKVLEVFKVEKFDAPNIDFVKLVTDLRKYSKRIDTYGENFLTKFLNPISKRYHTIFRQCDAVTGRFQSGDEKNGWYNAQNLPREKEYREPFNYKNRDFITTDLSGAEAVIMIDKARDEIFYKHAILNDDAHSPLSQAVWRAIGESRYNYYTNLSFKDMSLLHLTEETLKQKIEEADKLRNIIIDKSTNKHLRNGYKDKTFGVVYGMGIKKYMKSTGVKEEEAKIGINIQKAFMPKIFKMVETNARFASSNGYIIFNQRTNSRMWFSKYFDAQRGNYELDNSIKHEIESSARNSPIQGTQADMIKEILVEIHKEAIRQDLYNKVDLRLHTQVHDETGYSCLNANYEVEFIPEERDKSGQIKILSPVKYPLYQFINKMHSKIANRYLSFITMSAETTVKKHWTK